MVDYYTKLSRDTAELGYPLFELNQAVDANQTLAEMAKASDSRFWDGFAVVLAKVCEKGLFDSNSAYRHLKTSAQKSDFCKLMVLSLALYKFFNLRFSWESKLYNSLPRRFKDGLPVFLKKLKADKEFKMAGRIFYPQRLKSAFKNYFKKNDDRAKELFCVRDELKFEYAMSWVFSTKQKELFFKKLRREKLTKTEKEYFSRVVKKKALALANNELHMLAKKLFES